MKKLFPFFLVLLVVSCKEKADTINPSFSTESITNLNVRELPLEAQNKIQSVRNSTFTNLSRPAFTAKPSAEEVINKINQVNTPKNRIGQHLQLKVNTPSRARNGGEDTGDDTPSRSVTFNSDPSMWNVFTGQVAMNYNLNSRGEPIDITYNSNVTITAFGSNFGTYTQTNVLSNSYPMSDGSTVVVFQIQGTYNPPLTSLTGLSNSWLFTGYTVFPRLGSGGPIRGEGKMEVYENE